MSGFVIIVTGWRGATMETHGEIIANALEDWSRDNTTLRHGRCKFGGVDLIADTIARQWGWTVDAMPAEERDGRVLGPQRNHAMCAKKPLANVVLAFPGPGSVGTWDCLRWAQRYGIRFEGYPLTRT